MSATVLLITSTSRQRSFYWTERLVSAPNDSIVDSMCFREREVAGMCHERKKKYIKPAYVQLSLRNFPLFSNELIPCLPIEWGCIVRDLLRAVCLVKHSNNRHNRRERRNNHSPLGCQPSSPHRLLFAWSCLTPPPIPTALSLSPGS